MRRILIDQARNRKRLRRGGDREREWRFIRTYLQDVIERGGG